MPAAQRPDMAAAEAAAAEGWAALAADDPGREAAALRTFRAAIALAPARSDGAVAGFATAFADAAGDEPDGTELRVAHELVRDARSRAPARPDLLAASARLLLLAPGEANAAEARALAEQAAAAAPRDGSAPAWRSGWPGSTAIPPGRRARSRRPIAAVPGDRRLLTAAARARWAAGDAAAALAHAEARLALDPGHAGALALRAEVELACDRIADGRATLARWEAAVPGSPLPPLLLARLAYQCDADAPLARRLLEVALRRDPGDFTAARILAHRAAVELASGNVQAAEAAVGDALRRVPASAPARFQAALLAFRRGNAAALRESAGVLGDRAGAVAEKVLAARSAELSGTQDEAEQAYLAVAAAAPRDPAVLLATAGALARLHASGPAIEVARRALQRDPAEARLRRAPTDFWEGAEPLAEASRRLEAIGRAEPSTAPARPRGGGRLRALARAHRGGRAARPRRSVGVAAGGRPVRPPRAGGARPGPAARGAPVLGRGALRPPRPGRARGPRPSARGARARPGRRGRGCAGPSRPARIS